MYSRTYSCTHARVHVSVCVLPAVQSGTQRGVLWVFEWTVQRLHTGFINFWSAGKIIIKYGSFDNVSAERIVKLELILQGDGWNEFFRSSHDIYFIITSCYADRFSINCSINNVSWNSFICTSHHEVSPSKTWTVGKMTYSSADNFKPVITFTRLRKNESPE